MDQVAFLHQDEQTGHMHGEENGSHSRDKNDKHDSEIKVKNEDKDSLKGEVGLSYNVDETPGLLNTIILGIQHYLTAVPGIIVIPLILARAMCMFETDLGLQARGLVINTGMFVAGIATFLQTTFGIRLPTVQGPAGIFIGPAFTILYLAHNICPAPMNQGTNETLLYNDTDGEIVDGTELWQRRARELQGALIVSSMVQFALGATGVIGFLVRFISPLTVTVVIALIPLSLISATIDFAASQWGVALFTCAVIVVCAKYLNNVAIRCPSFSFKPTRLQWRRRKLFQRSSIFWGVALGWILSLILTASGVYTEDKNDIQYLARTDGRISVLHASSWFKWPYPGQWGLPRVTAAGIAAMIAATFGGIIESVGDYYMTARVSGASPPPSHAINRGIAMEGFGCLLNGVIGSTTGTTSYSQNSALIEMTGVGSRRVVQMCGVIMIVFGVITKFGAFMVLIPDPVLGGVALAVYGTLFAIALANLSNVDLRKSRTTFIVGFSLILGFISPTYISQNLYVIQTGVKPLDQIFTALLGNNVLVGGVLAVFLDLTLPGKFQNIRDILGADDRGSKTTYNLPFPTTCGVSKYIPFLPAYGD